MTDRYQIGTTVIRVNDQWNRDQHGEIVEMDDERVRILWRHKDGSKHKRTWQQRSAMGKRWAVLVP
jgi:ssDNA-binding replication factor A large subunit